MTTTYIGLVKEQRNIEGFTCKPGFGIFYDSNGKLAFSSGWESGGLIMVYHRTGAASYERRWEYVKGQQTFLTQQAEFYDKVAFDAACEEAAKIPEQRLAPPVYIKCTDVVPGHRCNNGGEYGFYSHYAPTDAPGVFWAWSSTTCDFDRCGTGYDYGEYVVLTKKRMRRLMQISDRIEEGGDLYTSYEDDNDNE